MAEVDEFCTVELIKRAGRAFESGCGQENDNYFSPIFMAREYEYQMHTREYELHTREYELYTRESKKEFPCMEFIFPCVLIFPC